MDLLAYNLKTLKGCQDFVQAHAPSISVFAEKHEYEPLMVNEKKENYYVTHYREYEADYLPALINSLQIVRPGQAVEVGPGWGTMSAWLIGRGWDLLIVDHVSLGQFITQDFLGDLGFIAHQNSQTLEYLFETDIFNLKSKKIADLVLMTQVIPHLKFRPDVAVKNAASLLKESGAFVCTALDWNCYPDLIPSYKYWRDVPSYLDLRSPCEATVVTMYTEETFSELLSSVFKHVTIWRPPESTCLFAVCQEPLEE